MKSDIRIWMPRFIGNYLADTQHLTPEADSAYNRIEMHLWSHGHMTEEELRIVSRLSLDAWSIAQASVKHMLVLDPEGLWFHPAIDENKVSASGKRSQAVEKARKAANARWKRVREDKAKDDAPSNAPSNAPALPVNIRKEVHNPYPLTPFPSEGKGELEPIASPSPSAAPENAEIGDTSIHPLSASGRASSVRNNGMSQSARTADKRYPSFRKLLDEFWGEHHGGRDLPWGSSDEKALSDLMHDAPSMTVEDFDGCLVNITSEIQVGRWNPDRLPRKWLRSLHGRTLPIKRPNHSPHH